MNDAQKDRLAGFHKTISEQLNARLAESPRFFGVLVIAGTAYGYVLWNFRTVDSRLFILASIVAYTAVLWSLWYLAGLGYAFRYLQNTQHRIEDELGWDSYRNETTGIPQENSSAFWLLPGIYHAHAFGLSAFLLLIVVAFFSYWPENKCGRVLGGIGMWLVSLGFVYGINLYYFLRFKKKRLPSRRESGRDASRC